MADQPGPIEDEELLYRRVATVYFDPERDTHPSPQAFRPRAKDTSGISVSRDKYTTIGEAAAGRPGKQYYVAVLRTGDLRAQGIEIVPKPDPPDDLGHAELPGLTYQNRRSVKQEEWQVLLAEELCLRIEGPFP